MIYLNHAATTPMLSQAVDAMTPYYQNEFYNPSDISQPAVEVQKKLRQARQTLADTLYASPDEIYFTSGGTESDNWALLCGARAMERRGKHIITSQVEHHAVLHTCKYLESIGFSVTYLKPDADGVISPDDVSNAIRPDTVMLSIMKANNETGVILPTEAYGQLARQHGLFFHSDCVQAYGHIPLRPAKDQIHALSISGHKLGGPKGIGFLYIKKGWNLPALLHGGSQETGHRAGTENVAGIFGLTAAAKEVFSTLEVEQKRLTALRNSFEEQVLALISGAHRNGAKEKRLPGHSNLRFEQISARALLVLLEMNGILASGGSACTSHSNEASHVLTAMGLDEQEADSSVRFTFGRENTTEELKELVSILANAVQKLRQLEQNH